MKKKLPYFISAILLLIYFVCYQSILSHVIYYHEQHHLFLFSKTYYIQTVHSEGIASYITNYIIQFFYINAIGSLLLATILTLIYLLCNKIIKKITSHYDLFQLSLLPSLYLFIYSIDINHSLIPITTTLAIIILLFVICLFKKTHWKLSQKIDHLFIIKNKKIYIYITFSLLVIYGTITSYIFIKSYNMNERQMILVDKSVKEKDWRLTLDYTEKYLQKKRTNQLIVYFHNLALYHTGQLPYHLFDFPQKLGVKGLYLPWNSDSRESEYGYHIYDNLGYINEAQRWETEAMVVWGETPSHLINLSKYSIMNGSPLIAQRFINLLKQSLYYKKEAIKIEKETKSRNFSKQETSHFINITNIGPNLLHICKQDSTNQMAFEYLMADLLLSNNVIRFAENLKFIKNFKYPKMPTNYEEALYIYKLGVDQSTFSKLGFKISEETEERFKRYYTLYKQQNLSELQNEFGNSYWYYLNFISPYGDKIIKN